MASSSITWITSIEGPVDQSLAIVEMFKRYLERKTLTYFVSELAFIHDGQYVKIWGCSTLFVHHHLLLELVRAQIKLGSWTVVEQRLVSEKESQAYRALVNHYYLHAQPQQVINPTYNYLNLITETKNQQVLFIKGPGWFRYLLRKALGF